MQELHTLLSNSITLRNEGQLKSPVEEDEQEATAVLSASQHQLWRAAFPGFAALLMA